LRGNSETAYVGIALLNLKAKFSALGNEVKDFAFECRCLAVTRRKMIHQKGEPLALNEQRIVLLDKSLHDNRSSGVFCHCRERAFSGLTSKR
jgi:hypothetical protein